MTEDSSIIFYCRDCAMDKICIVTDVTFKDGRIHKEARCETCGRFYKYLSQGLPDTFYFGKYRNRLMSEIAKEDPDYIKFMLNTDTIKYGLRQKLEKALYGSTTEKTK